MPDGLILPPGLLLPGSRRELIELDPINRRLLGFWPMQEAGGVTVDDISPWRTRGVAVNNPPSVSAPWGRARTFINNGGSGTRRINLGAYRPWSALQIPMTIAAWVRPTSSVNGTIFSQYNQFDFDGRFGKWLGITNGGQVQGIIGKSVHNYYQFFNGPTYTLNRWALMAWVLSGTTSSPSLRIFYNTTSTTHTPVALGTVDASVETWIGSSVLASTYPSNEGWAGDIGPVRLWGRALADHEMGRLARDPWAGTTSPAERLWVAVRVPDGGATYDSSIADSASAAESVASALATAGAITDAATVAETMACGLVLAGSVTDSAAGADALASALATAGSVSDAVTAAEGLAGGTAIGASVSDGVAAAEALAAAQAVPVAIADGVTALDAAAAALAASEILVGAVAGADAIAGTMVIASSLADAATATETMAQFQITGTPTSRTILLPARNRTRTLAARDRTIALPARRRTVTLPGDRT